MPSSDIIFRDIEILGQYFLKEESQKQTVAGLSPQSEVRVRHEPENAHDRFAAVVEAIHPDSRPGLPVWCKIGYIPKQYSPAAVVFAASGYRVYGEISGFTIKNPLANIYVEGLHDG